MSQVKLTFPQIIEFLFQLVLIELLAITMVKSKLSIETAETSCSAWIKDD